MVNIKKITMKKFLLFIVYTLLPIMASAYDIAVQNGDSVTIYYNYVNDSTELEVTSGGYGSYTGNVVIPEELTYMDRTRKVTSIDERAFYNCSGLISVTIPNNVTIIGQEAFNSCAGITSVIIPNSVTSILFGAFSYCSGLNSVTIGNSVTTIGSGAFEGCFGLTSVTLNSNAIVSKAYTNTESLTNIFGEQVTEFVIGNDVTGIGVFAFKGCTGLTSMAIPNNVTSIGDRAFMGCSSLESVTIGTGVQSVGGNVFAEHTPAKVIWLTNTPPSGYSGASGIENFVPNSQYTSLKNQTVYPFLSSMFEVGGVKYVPVSPSERTCDAIDCAYNESAENVIIGDTVSYQGVQMSVKRLHSSVCYHNPFIKTVEISHKGDLEDYAFSNCVYLVKAILKNEGELSTRSIYGCGSLKTVELGEKITSIGSEAFRGCARLKSMIIPDAVTSIGSSAFMECAVLASIQMGSGVNTINTNTFTGCSSLQRIQIPQNVTSIKSFAFDGCTSLKEVVIDEHESELTLASNGKQPLFASCPLERVYIGRNISYSTKSNYGYSPFYRNTTLQSVEIADKETEISPNEFYGCTSLKDVKIGNGVTKIGDWAFSGCSSLESFSFGSSVETIGQEAFSDCTTMTRLKSLATVPPVCGAQALDDINKWNCTLTISEGCLSAYQQADQWKDFFYIDMVSEIGSTTMTDDAAVKDYYTFDGKRINKKQRGLNIIRMSNGKTRKVVM